VKHAFIVYCHKEVEQTIRLRDLLIKSFPASDFHVYYDGPCEEPAFDSAPWVDQGPQEPDKCRGILKGLNALMGWSVRHYCGVVSFLHPDMVPTDREQFHRFLQRFQASGQALTFTPMLPNHLTPSFCNLHFRLPEALPLFPMALADEVMEANHRASGHWYNEMQAFLSWEDSWPEWHESAYHMGLMTVPHRNQFTCAGQPIEKLVHSDNYQYEFCDYCPESSVIHSHDPRFWENADALIQ
jgi:hypothetical protein